MSSSLSADFSSEKYDRKMPPSESKRKTSSRGMHGGSELGAQTKGIRVKQKRPDMPLYVPRARRLQEETSETHCANRHTSPGRQKVRRSNKRALEVEDKGPREVSLEVIHKANLENESKDCLRDFSLFKKTVMKDHSPLPLGKSSCKIQSNSVSSGENVHGKIDLTPHTASDTLLEKRFTSVDSTVIVPTQNLAEFGDTSNNSHVEQNPDTHDNIPLESTKNSTLSDSVSDSFSIEVGHLNSINKSDLGVSDLSVKSTVPSVSEVISESHASNMSEEINTVPVNDQNNTCEVSELQENTFPQSVSESLKTKNETITIKRNLEETHESGACNLVVVYANDKNQSCDSACSFETTSSIIDASEFENSTSEGNSVIDNPSCSTDCTDMNLSAEKIRDHNSVAEDPANTLNYELHAQNNVEKSYQKDSLSSSSNFCKQNETEINKSLKASMSDSDLSSVSGSVKTASESTIPGCLTELPLLSNVTVHPQNEAEYSESLPEVVKAVEEKLSGDPKDFHERGDNFDSSMEVESWDSMFDDDGECLNPEILKELVSAVGNVEIQTSKMDYAQYKPVEPAVDEEYGNVIEIHGFPVEFSTQDLISAFSCFRNQDFSIKWVDDCHALAIFSGSFAASEALTLQHPYVKVRPLSQGIKESKMKAKRCAEHLLPYKPRPATSATLARRLVTGALGLKPNVSREQREIERQAIKQARDRKRQVAKQRQDIWDGIVS